MALKDLPKYKDIRGTIRRSGRYPFVGTGVKDTIVIHHSLTGMKLAGSTPFGFANHHIDTNKWHGCAYPFVITWDGTIYQTDDLDRRTYHAGDTNTRSIGICVVGDFRKGYEKPTQAQMDSLYLLVKELKITLPKLTRILGHQECPGYSWKNCPGDNWNYREVINGNLVTPTVKGVLPKPVVTPVVAPKPVVTTPSKLPLVYTVQQGDTFWSISKALEGITVDEIKALNPSVDPTKLKVGQTLNLAKTPTGTTYTVKAGDTLYGIARAYTGIEVEDIKQANKLTSNTISIGQKLTIPLAQAKPIPTPPPVTKPVIQPVVKPVTPSYIGKRVEAKVNVRFYNKPSWADKDVAGTCKKGEGFTIVDRVTVSGAYQYKVKNSKGKIYYITASTSYVTVK